MEFSELLKLAYDEHASDLHLQADAAPIVRVHGAARALAAPALDDAQLRRCIAALAPQAVAADLTAAATAGVDFAFVDPGTTRFRCSLYSTQGRFGAVLRLMNAQVPSIETLHLPKVARDIAMARRGLVLVTGGPGSGRTSTLAAMVNLINSEEHAKIITVEDPVEYLHANIKSIVAQIDIGTDINTYEHALRRVLRLDPDVIVLGRLSDCDTLRLALRATDIGLQVFATMHAPSPAQVLERLTAMIPPNEEKLLVPQLARNLEGIISQRLVITRDGQSRRPAVEVLRGGNVTEKFILEGRLDEFGPYMESGQFGMQSFDQHLLQLYQEQVISGTEALRAATRPDALATALRGMTYVSASFK